MQKPLYAILLDGGFVTRKLQKRPRLGAPVEPVTADDVSAYCAKLQSLPEVEGYELLRIYFYNAHPATAKIKRPVSGNSYNLGGTPRFKSAQSLHKKLVLEPHFALRMGEVALSSENWTLKPRMTRQLIASQAANGSLGAKTLKDSDFNLAAGQKGVDMRVGLDIARLALRDMVRAIIVVTGDADFTPAFKFARREGVKIYLDAMGHGINPILRQHADLFLNVAP
ncbi:MAG: NYN domain-containing protein [Rhodospirillales bacterium]